MIEIARERYVPIRSAAEVLGRSDPWAVINRATHAVMLICRIRPPKPDAKRPDSTLTVRLDAPWRRYGDLAWVRAETGDLAYCGRWAHESLRDPNCRQWRIVSRLWPYLLRGAIPETVDLVSDEAFVRGRRLRFQAEHEDVMALLLKPPVKRARWYNERKLEMVDRFGVLTEKELAKVRAQRRGGDDWEKLDDGINERRCSECGEVLAHGEAAICRKCQRRLLDGTD